MSGVLLISICVLLVLLPQRYDPAIRLKEWQIKKGWHPESPARQSHIERSGDA